MKKSQSNPFGGLKSNRDRTRDYALRNRYRVLAEELSERVELGAVSFSRALASVPLGARPFLKRAVNRKFREVV